MAVPLSEAMVCQATVLETYRFLIALAEINCSNFFVLPREKFWTGFLTPPPKRMSWTLEDLLECPPMSVSYTWRGPETGFWTVRVVEISS